MAHRLARALLVLIYGATAAATELQTTAMSELSFFFFLFLTMGDGPMEISSDFSCTSKCHALRVHKCFIDYLIVVN
uniref:Secreted protein n=1 Tax=Oryza brachyantha TaxID=4533 RepID=J3KYA7_ORYBR